MALGALIVVAILAVAALQVPRYLKAHGEDQTTQTAANNSNPAAPGTSTPNAGAQPTTGAATSPTASTSPNADANQAPGGSAVGNGGPNDLAPSGTPGAAGGAGGTISGAGNPVNPGGSTVSTPKTPKSQHTPLNQAAGGGAQVESTSIGGGGASVGPPPVSAQELAELTHLHEQIGVRADAVNDRVENMRKEMAPNNLNSAITSAQARMNVNMQNFGKALSTGDLVGAKNYMNLAERELDFLEKKFNMQ
jgi:hypothetical protein